MTAKTVDTEHLNDGPICGVQKGDAKQQPTDSNEVTSTVDDIEQGGSSASNKRIELVIASSTTDISWQETRVKQPQFFVFDQRALTASRIVTGLLLIYEGVFALDFFSVKAFLTDEGVWPRRAVLDFTDHRLLQPLMMTGSVYWAVLFHSIFVIAAICITINYGTRKACGYCGAYWFAVLSRCWPITHSFDRQLQCLLYFAVLGDVYSTKTTSVTSPQEMARQYSRTRSLATFAISISTVMMYFETAFHKTHECWGNGEAIFLSLQSRLISRPFFANVVANHEIGRQLLQFTTLMVRPIEVLVPPIAILFPMTWWKWRSLAVLLLIAFHLGIACALRLNDIPFINIAVLLLFLPSGFFELLPGGKGRVSGQSKLRQSTAEALTKEQENGAVVNEFHVMLHSLSKMLLTICAFSCQMFMFIYSLWLFMENVCGQQWWSMPHGLRSLGISVGLFTNWKVFSPRPVSQDWWLSFPAILEHTTGGNGTVTLQYVDIFPMLAGEKPTSLARMDADGSWNTVAAQSLFYGKELNMATDDELYAPLEHTEVIELLFPKKHFSYTLRNKRWIKYFEHAITPGWGGVKGQEARQAEKAKRERIRSWLATFMCKEFHDGTTYDNYWSQWLWDHNNDDSGADRVRLVRFQMIMFLVDNTEVVPRGGVMPDETSQKLVFWHQTC